MSIAVGQRGDGAKEPPRRPGCHGSKRVGQFLLLIDKNQRGPIGDANTCANHHDNSRRAGSPGAPAPVVLLIVGLFEGEWLFIREQNSLPVQRCGTIKESSFQSYKPVVRHQKLNPLELRWLKMKLLFGYSAGRFARERFSMHSPFTYREVHGVLKKIDVKLLLRVFFFLIKIAAVFIFMPNVHRHRRSAACGAAF